MRSWSTIAILLLSGMARAQVGDSCNTGGIVQPSPSPCDRWLITLVEEGVCLTTSDCRSRSGVSHAGYCPGAKNIQCCVRPACDDSLGVCVNSKKCKKLVEPQPLPYLKWVKLNYV